MDSCDPSVRLTDVSRTEHEDPGTVGVPTWSPAANEIFYSSGDNQRVMVVEYSQRGGDFQASKPRVWAEARLVDFGKIRNFDVHPAGKRIVVEAPEQQAGAGNKPVLYFNFFDELRRIAK